MKVVTTLDAGAGMKATLTTLRNGASIQTDPAIIWDSVSLLALAEVLKGMAAVLRVSEPSLVAI